MTNALIAVGIVEVAILAATIWSTSRAFARKRNAEDFPHAL